MGILLFFKITTLSFTINILFQMILWIDFLIPFKLHIDQEIMILISYPFHFYFYFWRLHYYFIFYCIFNLLFIYLQTIQNIYLPFIYFSFHLFIFRMIHLFPFFFPYEYYMFFHFLSSSFSSSLTSHKIIFWKSIHLEVASSSFCLLVNSPWLLVFALVMISFIFLIFNIYCWRGIHFSWSNSLIFLVIFSNLLFSFHFFLFLASEALLFISFFWASFHSLSSPTLGIW